MYPSIFLSYGGINMSINSALIHHHETLYREYINNHRTNVQRAWNLMKNNPECLEYIEKTIINSNIDAIIDCVDTLINNHDLSKFGPEEFDAGRKNFYPVSPEEREENLVNYDKAWVHHYTNNMHHWNWWDESNNEDKMPFIYVIEMICDWEAMGYHFGNNSKKWYEKEKGNIHLGTEQRIFAEGLMNIICK